MLSPDFGDQISLHPSPSPAVVGVNILWLTSLLLDITSALFATLTLRWVRIHSQLPQAPDASQVELHVRSMHNAIAMTVSLLHLSVFLFLVGLVVFFYMINKIVAIVVSITVGLFGVVYLTLTILACVDGNFPCRTPLSDVWCSQRE